MNEWIGQVHGQREWVYEWVLEKESTIVCYGAFSFIVVVAALVFLVCYLHCLVWFTFGFFFLLCIFSFIFFRFGFFLHLSVCVLRLCLTVSVIIVVMSSSSSSSSSWSYLLSVFVCIMVSTCYLINTWIITHTHSTPLLHTTPLPHTYTYYRGPHATQKVAINALLSLARLCLLFTFLFTFIHT